MTPATGDFPSASYSQERSEGDTFVAEGLCLAPDSMSYCRQNFGRVCIQVAEFCRGQVSKKKNDTTYPSLVIDADERKSSVNGLVAKRMPYPNRWHGSSFTILRRLGHLISCSATASQSSCQLNLQS